MIDQVLEYAKGLGAGEEVLAWCRGPLFATMQKKSVTQQEAEHLVDFLLSDAAPARLRKMSFAQAQAGAAAWTKTSQKWGRDIREGSEDTKLVMDLGDGTRIVQLLTPAAFKREGALMSHCVGSMDPSRATIYSLRDSRNEPHVTFEVTRAGDSINQVKGKGNGSIHPRYIHSTFQFLERIGLKVRPTDMVNLGYYHVTDSLREGLSRFTLPSGKGPDYVSLGGNQYLFKGESND